MITDPKNGFQAERCWDGKFKRYGHGNGRVDVIPAFLNHQTNWDREIEFSVIAICPTLLNQTIREPRDVELMPQVAIADPVIQQLALALKTEIQTGCLSGRLYGEALGTALAARLVQNYAVSKPEFNAHGLPRSQLRQIIDYMRANLSQDVSIAELATLANLSASHFSRSFKQSTGIAPYQYLMQQRVARAQQLLKQRSLSISAIALECGFANQTHLTKVFRQLTGTTPKAYRKQ